MTKSKKEEVLEEETAPKAKKTKEEVQEEAPYVQDHGA